MTRDRVAVWPWSASAESSGECLGGVARVGSAVARGKGRFDLAAELPFATRTRRTRSASSRVGLSGRAQSSIRPRHGVVEPSRPELVPC